jgi:exopolysaccharide biosynthesis polyprenyl glycosylphosphotransferase
MSRKRLPVWKALLVMAVDISSIGLGLVSAYWLRFHSPLADTIHIRNGYDPEHYLAMLPVAWVVWFLALRLENLYRRRSRMIDFNVVRRIVTGSCVALLVVIAISFFHRATDGTRLEYSRLMTCIMLGVTIVWLIVNRAFLDLFYRNLILKRGLGQARTLILGTGAIAEDLYERLHAHPEHGMLPVGLIRGRASNDAAPCDKTDRGTPIVGTATELDAVLARERVDELLVAQPDLSKEHLQEILLRCEQALVEIRIVPNTTELLLSGMTIETLGGYPLLGIRDTPLQGWNAALKRLIDITAAAIGLTLTAPFIVIGAWLVHRHDGGAAFFQQERMGIDGRLFRIIKLRTMRLNAENETGPTFATDRDPRCTPLGGVLRRTHLDELPQLLNVLRGEMSLVGPRPERPYFIEKFRDQVPRYMARHKVKSGITGWAQVNGLCGLHGSIVDRVKFDLYYIENWSLWLDIKILFLTVFAHVKPGPV